MANHFGVTGLLSGRLTLVGPSHVDSLSHQAPGELVRSPFQDLSGSAVMPVAKAVVQPDWLLDDLELRMTRCVPNQSPVLRIGALLPAGESLHRIAASETRSWWLEMGLSDSDERTQRSILDAMLERSPIYLGWALVPLASEYLNVLQDLSVLMPVVEWVVAGEQVDRVLRDAVALSVVVPCLIREETSQVRDVIVRWMQMNEPAMIRMGLVVAAAYVKESKEVEPTLERVMLEACWAHASRVDTETAMAVGWILRELLIHEPERMMPVVQSRVQELSRQAMRTAVEVLTHEARARLTSKWRQQRRHHSLRVTSVHPSSTARNRRLS